MFILGYVSVTRDYKSPAGKEPPLKVPRNIYFLRILTGFGGKEI